MHACYLQCWTNRPFQYPLSRKGKYGSFSTILANDSQSNAIVPSSLKRNGTKISTMARTLCDLLPQGNLPLDRNTAIHRGTNGVTQGCTVKTTYGSFELLSVLLSVWVCLWMVRLWLILNSSAFRSLCPSRSSSTYVTHLKLTKLKVDFWF